jgi:hypothetical protein
MLASLGASNFLLSHTLLIVQRVHRKRASLQSMICILMTLFRVHDIVPGISSSVPPAIAYIVGWLQMPADGMMLG